MSPGVEKKLFRIAELFWVPTSRSDEPAQPLQDRRIIIEQADNAGIRIGQSERTVPFAFPA